MPNVSYAQNGVSVGTMGFKSRTHAEVPEGAATVTTVTQAIAVSRSAPTPTVKDELELPDLDDPQACAVYADCLIEQGDPRGEFIQVQLRLERRGLSADERGKLRKRERELLAQHARTWLGSLAPSLEAGQRFKFRRGFLHTINKGACLNDSGLQQLREFPQLRSLSSHEMTDAGLVHVAKIAALRTLDIAQTNVTDAGLAYLGELGALRVVVLSSTDATDAGLAHLARLEALEELHLYNTKVTDAGLVHLAELRQLRTLSLGRTGVTNAGLAYLAGLNRLRHLQLSDTIVGDVGLAHLANLTALHSLVLRNTSVGDSGLQHLAGLEALRKLDLDSTGVTDAGLAHLVKLNALRELDVQSTRISDAGMVHLFGLTKLKQLTLWKTRVTSTGVDALKQALPNCRPVGLF